MNASEYTNAGFVEAVTAGGPGREAAIRWLYLDRELRSRVVSLVKNNQGNEDDGVDICHEGIIVLDRNIREGQFRGEAPVKGYYYSICRFLWMNRMRKQGKVNLVEPGAAPEQAAEDTPELIYRQQETSDLLRKVLATLGDQCKKILEMWQLSYSMAEIAANFGMSSDAQARKAKYRCHLSLMHYLEKNPGIAEQLRACWGFH